MCHGLGRVETHNGSVRWVLRGGWIRSSIFMVLTTVGILQSVLVWVISRLGVEYICGIDSPLCIDMADQDRLEWVARFIFLSYVLVLILLGR